MLMNPTSLGTYEHDSYDGEPAHSDIRNTICHSALTEGEIVVDSFAGGGGASTGIEMALKSMAASGLYTGSTDVHVAINHSGSALAMHCANHPSTLHLEADIWTVDPKATTRGRPVGLLWASPDCTHFSRAKGAAPVSAAIRGLGMVVVQWAEQVKPRLIFLENVEEFLDWGPLIKGPKGNLIPDPLRKGKTFNSWVSKFRRLGYRVEWQLLRACDYGAPTIRKRLFVIMRLDGLPIVWPAPTHADPKSIGVRQGKQLPWRTAAEIIDWSLPCHSIFMDRAQANAYKKTSGYLVKRPLATNTLARIAAGVKRYVIDNHKPFIVTCNHRGPRFSGQHLGDPLLGAAGAGNAERLIMPMITTYYGARSDGTNERASTMESPLPTVTTANRHGVVSAILAKHGGNAQIETEGNWPDRSGTKLTPITTTSGAQVEDLRAFLTSHQTNDPHGVPVDVPLRAVTGKPKTDPVVVTSVMPPLTAEQIAKAQEVAEFLRVHGAWVGGEFVYVGDYIVVDISMRMLTPRELARAQGFPENYILDAPYKGGIISPSEQRHKIGNSVCPPLAEALVAANYALQPSEPLRLKQGWLFEEAA